MEGSGNRKVQAPKRRVTPPKARASSVSGLTSRLGGPQLIAVIAALVVVILVVAVLVMRGGSDEADANASGDAATAAALKAAGCTFRSVPDLFKTTKGAQHLSGEVPPQAFKVHYVTKLADIPKDNGTRLDVYYNSFPATSGPHYGATAIWNSYTEPLMEVLVVHNLEHGGIILRYGDKVSAADVEKLNTFYREDPNGILVAPLPRLGDKVAMTAWTKLATCPGYNEKALETFKSAFRHKVGPEASLFSRGLEPGTS